MLISDALKTVVSTIETTTGWTLGPQVRTSAENPNPNAAATFGISLKTSNGGWYRDKGILRAKHTLVVDFTRTVIQRQQFRTLLQVLDDEAKIINALQSQRLLVLVRASYLDTDRQWNSTGERLRAVLRFSLGHDQETYQ